MSNQFAEEYFDNKSLEELKKRVAVSWEPEYTRSHVKALGIPRKAKTFLEIGCGIGRLAKEICKRKSMTEYVGIDASKSMVEEADKYCNDNRAEFCMVEKNGKGFSSIRWFDFAFSWLVFQHIQDRETVLGYVEEMCNSLKSGGMVMCQLLATDEKPNNPLWVYHDPKAIISTMADCGVIAEVEEISSRWVTVRGVKA